MEHATQRRNYDLIDAISPSVPHFADVVGGWSERCATDAGTTPADAQLQAEFIAEQLLTLAHHFDYADEAGRTKMLTKIREVLQIPTLPENIVRCAVALLGRLCHTEDDRIHMLTEIVEDVRHPIQQRTTVAEARARARVRQVGGAPHPRTPHPTLITCATPAYRALHTPTRSHAPAPRPCCCRSGRARWCCG